VKRFDQKTGTNTKEGLKSGASRLCTVAGTQGKGGSCTAVTPLWGTAPTPGCVQKHFRTGAIKG
jgi:hypothetical protein